MQRRYPLWTAGRLALAAGVAFSVSALAVADDRDHRARDKQEMRDDMRRDVREDVRRDARAQTHHNLTLATWDYLKGINVFSVMGNEKGDDKSIGELKDLVISRGTGRIEFAALSTDRRLGWGDKVVLVPFEHLRVNATAKRIELDKSADWLKSLPEFSINAWKDNAGDREDNAQNRKALMTALAERAALDQLDPYSKSFAKAEKHTDFEGEVIDVERRAVGEGSGEEVILTVRGKDGKEHLVALGPSWYTTGEALIPPRSSVVKITAVRVPTASGEQLVVVEMHEIGRGAAQREEAKARAAERRWSLRGEKGQPAWERMTSSQDWRATRRFVLASEINGKDLQCRYQDCGSIDELIVETSTGSVAFLVIDPDENFLGIADTKRLVPWSVASVSWDGAVALDATREQILASAPVPDDVKKVHTWNETYANVYTTFGVETPSFRRDGRHPAMSRGDDRRHDVDNDRRQDRR